MKFAFTSGHDGMFSTMPGDRVFPKAMQPPSMTEKVVVGETAGVPPSLIVPTASATFQPGYRLHPLKGDMAGLWSIRVSGNWRVVFRFENNEAVDVDLVDYH